MLKRKPSCDLNGPHVSIFSDDPTLGRHKRKRALFRSKHNKPRWTPEVERDMSELLDFVLQHEEAFKKYLQPYQIPAALHYLTVSASTASHRYMRTSGNSSI